VIFGGAVPSVSGLIPSDLEIRRNHFTRPLTWRPGHESYTGTQWYVKNLFELKNAQRVIFDGNILEHNWPHIGPTPDGAAQHGYAVLLTVRDEGGRAAWATVSDVSMTNNIVRKSNVGVSIMGSEGAGTRRIRIENNLFEDIGLNWGNNDRSGLFVQANTVDELIIRHNTIINDGDILFANGKKASRLVFTSNIANHNAARRINPQFGIHAPGRRAGSVGLEAAFEQHEVTGNVMFNASGFEKAYPDGNHFPSDNADVGFVDCKAGDYRLRVDSPYRTAGTSGKTPGADMSLIDAPTTGVVEGQPLRPARRSTRR
jgi:hypothetical protein